MNKLVLVSSNYPYGKNGDNVFLKHETSIMSQCFEKIVVVSTGSGGIDQSLPSNIKAVNVRLNKIKIVPFFSAIIDIIRPNSRIEIRKIKEMYHSNIKSNLCYKALFRYYYAYHCMKKTLISACRDAELAYSYWFSSRAYALARLRHEKKINCKIITRAHGFDCFLERGVLPFREFIAQNIDDIYFISETGKEYFASHIKPYIQAPYANTHTQYLGLDRVATPQTYFKHDTLSIVTCSSIIPVKRLDIMIYALSRIEDINIEWTHFGNGSEETNINNLAAEKLDKKPNVTYRFMGFTDNLTLMEYYQNNYIDLFVNCSDSEGIPVSIMEAFSFGIPTICRNVGGNSEINIDNTNRYLIDGEDESLAIAIENFYKMDEIEKQKRREEVLDIFNERFSEYSIKGFYGKIAL